MENTNSFFPTRKRNRLKDYNYSINGFYFITICVKNKISSFGDVKQSNVFLNEYGQIIKQSLLNINNRFSCCEIDYYIIMPNHIHFILNIENKYQEEKCNVSEIIRVFKSITTIELHKHGLVNFKWQRSFYDRIIRNEKELFHIRNYIEQNPLRWEIEKDNPENIDLF